MNKSFNFLYLQFNFVDHMTTSKTEEPNLDRIDRELENILNHPAPAYGDKSYWDNRYSKEKEVFEWYFPFSTFQSKISLVSPVGVALDVGCGRSDLPAELIHYGFAKVIAIDFSEAAIEQAKENQLVQNVEYQVCDCTKMTFQQNYFNAIFDKGTYDTVLCSETGAAGMLKEIKRVLRPGGYYVLVSLGVEGTRKPVLEKEGFSVLQVVPIEHDNTKHYVYICQKPE